MTLREKQSKFVRMLWQLIGFAHINGFELTLGESYVEVAKCPHCGAKVSKHIDDSTHFHRLAQDLNLFKDGVYLKKTEDHKLLGEFWESIGGCWGGRFGESAPGAGDGWDGNHYSLEHDGIR
jgi:hypothetical protein